MKRALGRSGRGRAGGSVAVFAVVLGALAADAEAQLAVQRIGRPFEAPVLLEAPPGDSTRLVVGEQGGAVWTIREGATLSAPFLELGALVSEGGEQGLLDLAFHPDYASSGRVFVHYTDLAGESVVACYTRDAVDPERLDPSSGVTLCGPLEQPFTNHNGGSLEFGPDGMLYLALGDGGASPALGNRAQDLSSPLGKLLRFDVELAFPHVPADNPFVGLPGVDERIWASGLRNPWRVSFDRLTGDLWIADVGLWTHEEIDFEPAGSAGGANYGWTCMEGPDCTAFGGCACHSAELTTPVHSYDHSSGCSITGGRRYRGAELPTLQGRYVYADFCSGGVHSIAFDGLTASDPQEHTADLAIPGIENPVSFGEDAAGELYLVDRNGGEIWKLVQDGPSPLPYCEGAPNSAGPGARIASNGNTSVTGNAFVLSASGVVPDQPGLFYYGPNQVQIPFGEGLRCVDGAGVGTFRLTPPLTSDAAGLALRAVDFHQAPANSGAGAVLPGALWNFQLWYRDPLGGPAGFNLSDGLAVRFVP